MMVDSIFSNSERPYAFSCLTELTAGAWPAIASAGVDRLQSDDRRSPCRTHEGTPNLDWPWVWPSAQESLWYLLLATKHNKCKQMNT